MEPSHHGAAVFIANLELPPCRSTTEGGHEPRLLSAGQWFRRDPELRVGVSFLGTTFGWLVCRGVVDAALHGLFQSLQRRVEGREGEIVEDIPLVLPLSMK
jgi:hypothetical protein